jgi:hypothetical protein
VFDTWTGLRASSTCPDYTKEEFALNVTDSWAIGWIQNSSEGKAWAQELGFNEPIKFAPSRDCQPNDPHPIIEITSPNEGQLISISPLDIFGKLDVSADFQDYRLEYGIGDNPIAWNELSTGNQPVSQPAKIYSWDLKSIPQGIITLRITMHSIRGGYAERKLHLNIQVPTPTPTLSPSPTLTPTPTQTVTPTATDTQTITPSPYPTATQTPVITETPTPTFTPPP